MSVAIYAEKFSRLAVNVAHGRASPHKICMLLAVLDLARGGGLTENRIRYEPMLLERYRRFFEAVRAPGDHPNPYFPFFHLAGDLRGGEKSFWALKAVTGREAVFAAMSTARSAKEITDNIAHAELDAALFALLQDPAAIDALTESLARHWFGRGLEDLTTVVERSAAVSRYERRLRSSELTPEKTSGASAKSSPRSTSVVSRLTGSKVTSSRILLLRIPIGAIHPTD